MNINKQIESVLNCLPVNYKIEGNHLKIYQDGSFHCIGLKIIEEAVKRGSFVTRIIDRLSYDLSDLNYFIAAGYKPIKEPFTFQNECYQWIDATPESEDDEISPDFGYMKTNCMFIITDESGRFVDEKGIIKVGSQYFYFPYNNYNECTLYSNLIGASYAFDKLNLHNNHGNLNHSFEIVPVYSEER